MPPNSIGEDEFYGFVDCLLESRIRYDKHLQDGAQLLSGVKRHWSEIPTDYQVAGLDANESMRIRSHFVGVA